MTINTEGTIAFEFEGPTLATSLGRAVEGFADAVADVHPSVVGDEHPVALVGATPAALLLAVLEECLRCRIDGKVAIGFVAGEHSGEVLAGRFRTVPCDDPHVVVAAPPRVVSWHEVSLQPTDAGWSGRVVAR